MNVSLLNITIMGSDSDYKNGTRESQVVRVEANGSLTPMGTATYNRNGTVDYRRRNTARFGNTTARPSYGGMMQTAAARSANRRRLAGLA